MLFGCLFIYLSGIKTVYPYTLKVRLISKLGKNTAIDNNFFFLFLFWQAVDKWIFAYKGWISCEVKLH